MSGDKKTKILLSNSQAKRRRGRNSLTFYEKIAVIRHHDANKISRNSLARMFQCCTTQIRNILERKDELLTQWQVASETNAASIVEEMTRKRREFEMKAMGFILHQWVERCRHLHLNMNIDTDTLKIVALKMAAVLNIPNFRPTNRWIEKFRLKFKYKEENLAMPRSAEDPHETLSVEDIIIEFKQYLPSFMQQEISNITSNNFRVEQGSAEEDAISASSETVTLTNDDSEDTNSPSSPTLNQISTDNVLQYLSLIQQFTLSHSDYRAMAMIAQIEDYIRENYVLSEELHSDQAEDGGDEIILVE